MRNKKAYTALEMVTAAAILLVILWVVVYGIINNIILGKQVPSAEASTEQVTKDCDEDGIIGISDRCPCDPNVKLEKDVKCGIISDMASKNCPKLCPKK